jgi:hypothetical protein
MQQRTGYSTSNFYFHIMANLIWSKMSVLCCMRDYEGRKMSLRSQFDVTTQDFHFHIRANLIWSKMAVLCCMRDYEGRKMSLRGQFDVTRQDFHVRIRANLIWSKIYVGSWTTVPPMTSWSSSSDLLWRRPERSYALFSLRLVALNLCFVSGTSTNG